MRSGIDDQLSQSAIERVLRIRTIEPLIPIASTRDQAGGLEFRELILHGLERKKREPRQFTHIQFLAGVSEQQPENLRPHDREQLVQKRRVRHSRSLFRRLKAVESKGNAEVQ